MRLVTGAKLVYRRLVHRDVNAGYVLAGRATRWLCPPYRLSDIDNAWHHDEEFFVWHDAIPGGRSSRSADRKYLLRSLCALASDVEGDVAECGSYRGASAYILAKQLLTAGRTLHIFDSFEGLSEPCTLDGTGWHAGALAASEEECRRVLEEFEPNVRFYRGWIPSRFQEVSDRSFAFVHVDVDLYEPTRSSIEFFYPRMRPGALLVLDDYGSRLCPGARAAADEFFASRPEAVVDVPTGQGLVIKR